MRTVSFCEHHQVKERMPVLLMHPLHVPFQVMAKPLHQQVVATVIQTNAANIIYRDDWFHDVAKLRRRMWPANVCLRVLWYFLPV